MPSSWIDRSIGRFLKVEKLIQKLSAEIITGNYELVYQSREKCEIYRDTGVSKNLDNNAATFSYASFKHLEHTHHYSNFKYH